LRAAAIVIYPEEGVAHMNVKRFMMKLFSLRTLLICVIAFKTAKLRLKS